MREGRRCRAIVRTGMPGDRPLQTIRHSGWLFPAAIVAAVAVLCVLFLFYYLAPAPTALIEERFAPTLRRNPVALRVGSGRFTIPANYLPYASERLGGTREQVVLYALLPDLRGYSGKDTANFDDTGANSPVIHILIKKEAFDVGESERLRRIYLGEVTDRRGQKGPFGLIRYAFRSDSGYRGEDLFVGKTGTHTVVIRCTRPDAEIPSANCLRETRLSPDVSLSYRFGRAHLADWRAIASGVNRLIASFAPKR